MEHPLLRLRATRHVGSARRAARGARPRSGLRLLRRALGSKAREQIFARRWRVRQGEGLRLSSECAREGVRLSG